MNQTITSREELLLAKIAGQDVSLDTMTPPVASSLTEKLMLDIADRLDDMSSGGETPSAATTSNAGIVKMAANVSEAAGEAPTAAEFKALLDALITAGIMAAPAGGGQG
ncbi:MAG: hypothetical protein IKN38_03085 [Clostridia bacterium]|nr:hypothetical protein [Clostridia bacterium]